MIWIVALSAAVLSYLIGSIPAGYIAGKLAGVDVRQHGSGNIGATNVLRVLGKPAGYAVFAFDTFKGFAAVRLAMWLTEFLQPSSGYTEYIGILAAGLCVIGHSFPIWLNFQGGKGVATSAGVAAGLLPVSALVAFIVWVIVFLTTRYVSVASVIAAIALPVTVGLLIYFGFETPSRRVFFYFTAVVALIVILRHRSNFARLMNGTEERFSRK